MGVKSTVPLIGADLEGSGNKVTAAQLAAGVPPAFAYGTTVFGTDGRKYVYYLAGAAHTADTTRFAITAATGASAVDATNGPFMASVTLASGDAGWAYSLPNYTEGVGSTTLVPS